MSATPRKEAVRAIASRTPVPGPTKRQSLPDLFGSKVFSDVVQRERLPKSVYKALRRTIDEGAELDLAVADSIATAMKDWAVEHGATHFTHWFQPLTGLTAEKHDSFLSTSGNGRAILEFSGTELIQGEPDASSFPSGGLRATFEARGYTGWDPLSPAFLRDTDHGATLMIPTVFCSWTGDALDSRTPLLRSGEALDRHARRVLAAIGDTHVKRVQPTVGAEQEYFLVDKQLWYLRPDLISCGRTLFGARPPKGQELEDHYFGVTPRRVLAFMMDLERELWRVGVPARTRHSEVAPGQFEMAPIFESASVAIDHNMLAMELMQVVADRHGMVCLMHEKPFAGVNGSGKHNNYSLSDDTGRNLLEPGSTPHDNLVFILFLTAIIRAVDVHQDLLRATIASAGNDHRLGANEAPPAIISIFLGGELEGVVEALIGGTAPRGPRGGIGAKLELGVMTLPDLPRHTSDRNRTSPFAFTGNKFEFRAVGSSQNLSAPNVVLNTAVAESLDLMATRLEAAGGDVEAAARELIRELLTEHQRILFSGDNYSEEWRQEAERRGLSNLVDSPAALERFSTDETAAFFAKYEVLNRRELDSAAMVYFETYNHRIGVESLSAISLAATSILPAALTYQRQVAETLEATDDVLDDEELLAEETSLLRELVETITHFRRSIKTLRALVEERNGMMDDALGRARFNRDRVLPAMAELRRYADTLEDVVDDDIWPLPKYRELLYVR